MENNSFSTRRSTQLFVIIVQYCKQERWAGGLGMRPGKQDSNTISCIPKPHVGFGSGNETRTI